MPWLSVGCASTRLTAGFEREARRLLANLRSFHGTPTPAVQHSQLLFQRAVRPPHLLNGLDRALKLALKLSPDLGLSATGSFPRQRRNSKNMTCSSPQEIITAVSSDSMFSSVQRCLCCPLRRRVQREALQAPSSRSSRGQRRELRAYAWARAARQSSCAAQYITPSKNYNRATEQ